MFYDFLNCKELFDGQETLPINYNFEKYVKIIIPLRKQIKMTFDDQDFNFSITLFHNLLKIMIDKMKNEYIFSEPLLIYIPKKNEIEVKIGMMSRDRYKLIIECTTCCEPIEGAIISLYKDTKSGRTTRASCESCYKLCKTNWDLYNWKVIESSHQQDNPQDVLTCPEHIV